MPDVEDQDDKPVVDLVEDSPVTRSDTPRAGVTYKLSGLAGIWGLGELAEDLCTRVRTPRSNERNAFRASSRKTIV
jgi:hypothetical protein